MRLISQQKYDLCYNVCLLECVYHVCVFACVYGYASCFLHWGHSAVLALWFVYASFLDCVRFCMVKKIHIFLFFFYIPLIPIKVKVKFLWPGYIFFLLHPHKIIESNIIFCVCSVWQNSIEKICSFFINSMLFGVRVKLTREGHVCSFFSHPFNIFESTQVCLECKCDKSQEVSDHNESRSTLDFYNQFWFVLTRGVDEGNSMC